VPERSEGGRGSPFFYEGASTLTLSRFRGLRPLNHPLPFRERERKARSRHRSRGAFRARALRILALPKKKGAERRETPGCARPRERPASRSGRPSGLRRPLAIEDARLPALHFRHRFGPGPRFRRRDSAPTSASSWREVRSDLQVEPRAARVRNAFRPRVPHPAPPKRCLARAPLGEQDTRIIRVVLGTVRNLFFGGAFLLSPLPERERVAERTRSAKPGEGHVFVEEPSPRRCAATLSHKGRAEERQQARQLETPAPHRYGRPNGPVAQQDRAAVS
jgi:hypothetical protein